MATLYIPTKAEIESLAIGDIALDSFGKMAEVVEISYRGTDVHGKVYVGFYTRLSESAKVSHSYKEGRLVRTVATSREYTSRELDAIEAEMLAEAA